MDNKEIRRDAEGIEGKTNERPRWQQVVYILAPFFLLLACLGLINFVPRTASSTPQPEVIVVKDGEVTAVSTTTSLPTTQPTATMSPTPTTVPIPTLPPDATINLLGPPDNSAFRKSDTITLYADWTLPLEETQHLAAYIRFDKNPPIQIETLDEPNAGQIYRWQLDLSAFNFTETTNLQWWLQLQTSDDTPPLLVSPARQVTLLP
jgi:hypothetical protein